MSGAGRRARGGRRRQFGDELRADPGLEARLPDQHGSRGVLAAEDLDEVVERQRSHPPFTVGDEPLFLVHAASSMIAAPERPGSSGLASTRASGRRQHRQPAEGGAPGGRPLPGQPGQAVVARAEGREEREARRRAGTWGSADAPRARGARAPRRPPTSRPGARSGSGRCRPAPRRSPRSSRSARPPPGGSIAASPAAATRVGPSACSRWPAR